MLLAAMQVTLAALHQPASQTGIARKVDTQLLYEYPVGTEGWIENIAVRADGSIIFTSLGSPGNLHTYDPFTPSIEPATITGFDYSNTLGIAETETDVFYVLSADFNITTISITPGTNTIWRVDFNRPSSSHSLPTPVKVATLSNAKFLNGLTAFNESILMSADSALGVVWATDLNTNTSWIAADDPLMKPVPGEPYQEGINGLHFRPSAEGRERTLCFTNSQQYIFACIPFCDSAHSTEPAEVVATPASEKGLTEINWDDFAFDEDGTAYIATEIGHTIQAVTPSGEACIIAGDLNSTAIGTPTSVALGRKTDRERTAYAVTAGSVFFPIIVNGTSKPTGPQIVAVDLHLTDQNSNC